MKGDFVVCARDIKGKKFGNEPGPSKFLVVAPGQLPATNHALAVEKWVKLVMAEGKTGKNDVTGKPLGDILVFIHGYNNDQDIVMRRHRQIVADLQALNYQGTVVTFDWPSADKSLNYLEDRVDAKRTALQLVTDCILLFVAQRKMGCEISVHLLAHSTGAFVVREAFDDADDRAETSQVNWAVSQVMFIGGDISRGSMSAADSKSDALFRHAVRITNYSNPYDSVLKLSNVKRAGMAPRVGRVGLPDNPPPNAVNVDCGEYWKTLDEKKAKVIGSFSHSWHIGDPVFAQDILTNIQGNIDRHLFPTRRRDTAGKLHLTRPAP